MIDFGIEMANFLLKKQCMETTTQISYNGYRAYYKITSLNSTYYRAELTGFSGIDTEQPPATISFVNVNQRPIASADVINVVKDLLKQIGSKKLSPC
jgi:hypothetical protein